MQPTVLCTLLSMNRHVVCTMIPVIEVAVKKLAGGYVPNAIAT